MSGTFGERQLRLRVLEALEARMKGFRRPEDLWPLRVPREPVQIEEVAGQALRDEPRPFDPLSLRSRTLLHLEWDDGSTWEAWVIALPSGRKLYCDTGGGESRMLASGGRNEGEDSDRAFLEILARSGGGEFGIEMSGGAPSRVRSAIADREFLVDFFLELFEVSRSEASVHAQLSEHAWPPEDAVNTAGGSDFRNAVERWLRHALQRH
jgi:hypothetical protein